MRIQRLADSERPSYFCHLTCDLEDYKHATMRALGLPPRRNGAQVERAVEALVRTVENAGGNHHITFFTTGQVARDHAAMIRGLSRAGHEFGCHTDLHDDVSSLTQAEFVESLRRSNDSISAASERSVLGFRAPNFSIDASCPWAYETLEDEGFLYDSSMTWDGSGPPAASSNGLRLIEFPIYHSRVFPGASVRVIGGTYFRLLPISMIVRLLKDAFNAGFVPIIYIHPADLDDRFEPVAPEELKPLGAVAARMWSARQKQWSVGTCRALGKLERVLRLFPNRGPLANRAQAAAH